MPIDMIPKQIGNMIRTQHMPVAYCLEFYISRLAQRIGMLMVMGNRPGMMNDTAKLPRYQNLLGKLQAIQNKRNKK